MSIPKLLKKLAGQTAVYGLTSIVGRLLNYLLVPLYTYTFQTGEYGLVIEMYGYVGFFIVLFTYGMETAFFRYVKDSEKPDRVYSTSMISLLFSSIVLVTLLSLFSQPLANLIQHPGHREYIVWFALILGFDALAAIPFAYLRYKEKPVHFALIKTVFLLISIGLNIFFIVLCPAWIERLPFIQYIYNPNIGVGYIFISNLIASAVTLFLLLPEILKMKPVFDVALWKKMIWYALPLIIVGFSGSINELFDRAFLKYLLPYDMDTNMSQLGIYGACYKLSILITLFVQAFRYAGEPFFFAQSREKNAQEVYAIVMKYFVAFLALIFLGVLLFLDIIKYFIHSNYHEGLNVVPILLMANLFLGIHYNLAIWYKLSDLTKLGAYIALFGAIITIVLNIILVPVMSYTGAAWATLICYFAMIALSYFWCQKYYPIPYDLKAIFFYLFLALVLYFVHQFIIQSQLLGTGNNWAVIYPFRFLLIGIYLWIFYRKEKAFLLRR